MIVVVIGMIEPAPIPCTARNTISETMLHATPQSTEPRRKTPIPNSSIGLRPKTSDNRP